MKILRRIDSAIARTEQGLLLLMLASIVGVNLLQISFRLIQSLIRTVGSDFVLSAPSWPADINRILVLWIAMVGGSLATRNNEHIKVDFLARIISGRVRLIINGVIFIAGITVCLLLVFYSYEFLKMEYELKETLVALPVPLWCIQLIIPVGFMVIAFRFLLLLLAPPPVNKEAETETLDAGNL